VAGLIRVTPATYRRRAVLKAQPTSSPRRAYERKSYAWLTLRAESVTVPRAVVP